MDSLNGLNELNGGRNNVFTLANSKEYRFLTKTELPKGQPLYVRGVYIARGKFGFQSVIIFDDGKNLKGRYSFSDNGKKNDIIIKDSGLIQAIKSSKLMITFEFYHSKKYDKDAIGATFEITENPIY